MLETYKAYSDCTLCKGSGYYEGVTSWGLEWLECACCLERYIDELRELLCDVLVCEIPNGVAEKIVPLLQGRPLTPQERLDNAYRLAEESNAG